LGRPGREELPQLPGWLCLLSCAQHPRARPAGRPRETGEPPLPLLSPAPRRELAGLSLPVQARGLEGRR